MIFRGFQKMGGCSKTVIELRRILVLRSQAVTIEKSGKRYYSFKSEDRCRFDGSLPSLQLIKYGWPEAVIIPLDFPNYLGNIH